MSVSMPVVRAQWRDIGWIADLVADALCPTALGAWLVPDERRRPSVLAAVARIWAEHALLFGDAFLLDDGSAAAVWFHRYRPIPPPARYADRLTDACGEHLDRFDLFDRALAARRPTAAHNHLALLAAPGSDPGPRIDAVLAGAQRRMDTLGLPTYAEAFAEADRDLFRRHGYAERDAFPLPDGIITHPMWRISPFWSGHPGGNVRRPAHRPAALMRNGRANGWALH